MKHNQVLKLAERFEKMAAGAKPLQWRILDNPRSWNEFYVSEDANFEFMVHKEPWMREAPWALESRPIELAASGPPPGGHGWRSKGNFSTLDEARQEAERFRTPQPRAMQYPITMNHDQAANMLLDVLEDKLGGDDWDDQRLVDIAKKWIVFPIDEDRVDASFVYEVAEELMKRGLDPRDQV
jgi:hypothetical protein